MEFIIPTVPDNYDAQWLSDVLNEMKHVASEIREPFIYFEELNAALAKPRNGIIVYADGTNWDPGQGQGLYQYQNSTWVLLQGNKTRTYTFDISNFRKGAIAPVDSTLGSTPTIYTLYFSATNELISDFITMEDTWDKNYDLTLHLEWALASAQSDSDALSLTLDYIIPVQGTTGEGLTKTSTQLTLDLPVTTEDGLAVADLYQSTFILDKDDIDNGFAPGDNAIGVGFEVHMTNLTGVADIHLVGGHLNYTAMY